MLKIHLFPLSLTLDVPAATSSLQAVNGELMDDTKMFMFISFCGYHLITSIYSMCVGLVVARSAY